MPMHRNLVAYLLRVAAAIDLILEKCWIAPSSACSERSVMLVVTLGDQELHYRIMANIHPDKILNIDETHWGKLGQDKVQAS